MARDPKPRTVYWLEKELYLNITNKCSNSCIFCFTRFKRGVGNFTLKLDHEPSFEEVISELEIAMRKNKWEEAVFCGFGEPTARLDLLLAIARWIKKRYPAMIIRVNTNGHANTLNPGRNVVAELKAAGIDRVSVSLNAGDEKTYNEICRPSFEGAYYALLEFIENAKQILNVEVSAVTTPEVEVQKVEALAKKKGVKFRLRPCIQCFW